jgi:hypothetical protein
MPGILCQDLSGKCHRARQNSQPAIPRGDPADALLPLVYDELRKLAVARLAHLPPGQTLQPTALVHEAYLRLQGRPGGPFDNRAHFFFAAARAMRDILVEQARSKSGPRRGGAITGGWNWPTRRRPSSLRTLGKSSLFTKRLKN